MKAIETEYAGCRFRSRLEARWAVVFDHLLIPWQYEPQGFERVWGGENVRYLPDFYLPESETWVEVKGSQKQLDRDWERMEIMLDWGSPIPGVTGSYGADGAGLVILGDVPRPNPGFLPFFPLIQHRKGLYVSASLLAHGSGFASMSGDPGEPWGDLEYLQPPSIAHRNGDFRTEDGTEGTVRWVNEAFAQGRSARFER